MSRLPIWPHKLLNRLYKMQASFEEWKKNRDGRGRPSPPRPRAPSVTSRVALAIPSEEPSSSGVYSYNQMKRVEKGPSHRPPSEVGSVRSYRSVMTVEEQVSALERKVDDLITAQKEAAERDRVTQELLADVLRQLSVNKGSGKSK